MHAAAQIFKNDSSVVKMIFSLIFTSIFLTHAANFCNLKGSRLKFSVCLILPYPSASIPLQAAVCAPLLYQYQAAASAAVRGAPRQRNSLAQWQSSRRRWIGWGVSRRARERLLKLHPAFSATGPTGRHAGSLSFLCLGKQNASSDRGQWWQVSLLVRQAHLLWDCPSFPGALIQ